MGISKMFLKHDLVSTSGFYKRFCSRLSFQTVFLTVQTLTPLFSLTVPNFFMLLDRKFNEDSKNVLKNMIRSLQVGFTGNLVL